MFAHVVTVKLPPPSPRVRQLGHYFKALYDEDLLDEELLISWCGPVTIACSICEHTVYVFVPSHAQLDTSTEEAKRSSSFIEWLS